MVVLSSAGAGEATLSRSWTHTCLSIYFSTGGRLPDLPEVLGCITMHRKKIFKVYVRMFQALQGQALLLCPLSSLEKWDQGQLPLLDSSPPAMLISGQSSKVSLLVFCPVPERLTASQKFTKWLHNHPHPQIPPCSPVYLQCVDSSVWTGSLCLASGVPIGSPFQEEIGLEFFGCFLPLLPSSCGQLLGPEHT